MQAARLPRGFTLIEIMVVLVIVGVFAGLASLSIDGMQSRRSDEEVSRLRRLLEMAGDYADTRGTPLAVDFLPNGYRFSALQASGEWHLLFAPSPFAERSWGTGVSVASLEVDGTPVEAPLRIVFGTEAPEYRLQLATPEGSKQVLGRISGAVEME